MPLTQGEHSALEVNGDTWRNQHPWHNGCFPPVAMDSMCRKDLVTGVIIPRGANNMELL